MKNIVLTGLMGCGKTSVGKALALKNKDFEFVDIDEQIEKFQNMKIEKIFKNFGEKFFRELEVNFIKKYSMKSSKIISTGGGACENIKNVEALQERGVLFYLQTTPQSLYERLKNDKTRPKLQNTDVLKTLEELLKKREKNYNLADFCINTDNRTVDKIADEIIEKYEQFNG